LTIARRHLADVAATVVTPPLMKLPTEDRAAAIFRQMHESVLVGQYDRGATDLRRALAGGNYNCLSALVIYHELCRRADVPLTLWSQPGHVFCKLGDVRIEPTCRQWLAPAADFAELPRQIAPVELVGRFYYNRGVDHLERREFAAGVAALQIACRLDSRDADARDNLLAGLNNWALALAADDQHAAAAALIARGLAIDPAFPPLLANERYVLQRQP
jgi:hypothetical protein